MTDPRISFSRAWRRTFWQVYDHLGLFVLINLLWLLCSLTVILLPSATASLFRISYLTAVKKPVTVGLFLLLILKYFLRSTFLTIILAVLLFLLIFNIRFYLNFGGTWGLVLAGITFWILVFFVISTIYIFPLFTRRAKIWKPLFYSFILLINNFRTSLCLFICMSFLFFIQMILPIIGMSLLSSFAQNSFMEIESIYNPDIRIASPDRAFKELIRPWEYR